MSSDGKKIKFLCSFGGKIIPRPSDGALRYVGGDTRIISVREGVTFSELMWKVVKKHGGPVVLKYQLPEEDLDALITVSCPEDLENMMEEYKKFEHAESSRKLRLFLFDVTGVAAVSDVAEGTVSAQPPPALLSSSGFPVSVNFSECSTLVSSTRHAVAPVMAEPSPLPPLHVPPPTIQSVAAPVVPPIAVQASESFVPQNIYPQEVESLRYVPNYDRIEYVSPTQLGIGGAPTDTVGYVAIAPPVPVALVSGTVPVPPGTGGAFGPYFVGMPNKLCDDPNIPNLQSPPLQPSNYDGYSGGGGGCTDVHACHGASSLRQNEMRLEECVYCNKRLPHAHSNILIQEHGGRANSSILEASPLFHSFPMEGELRLHSPSKMVESANSTGILEHKTEDAVMDSSIVDSNVYYGTDQAQSCIDRSGRRYILPPYADKSPCDLLSTNNMVIERQERSHEPHFDARWVPANKIMLSSSPSGIGVTSAGIAGIQAFEPLSLVAGDKSPLDNHTGQKNGMTEMHYFSPGVPSLDDQRSVDGDVNIRASKEMKPIYSQLITDSRESRSQINDHEVYPSNSYPTAEEIDTLLGTPLSTTLETACLYTTQPLEASPPSLLGNLESYPPKFAAGVKSPIQHEQLLEPEVNGQITVGNFNLQTPQLQPGIVFSHVSSHPISDLVSSHIRNPSENVGVNCDSGTSNSLFSNQDPWSIIQDSQMFSPKQKVAKKELFNTEVLRNEKLSRNINNGDVPSLLEEGFLNPQPNILDSDLFAEPIKHSQEEHIKRELQATAEGVAALVLQPRDTNESQSQSLNSKGTLNNDKDLQQNIISHDDKFQDANSKEWKITDHTFQIPGDIEHLQIIKNSDLEELAELGSGTFGTVYHGKWRGTDVAIKRINDRCFAGKSSEKERQMSDFWNEACKLANLHHPNVVAFYGIVLDGPGGVVATVTEYMVNGSLRSALQRNEKAFDWRKRLLLAMDVAFGMEYLHGKNIVHFDLKSDNLLVNLRDSQRPICKVGDLGLSKVKCKTLISGGVRGTLPWMAPELLNGSSSLVSEKVDVFSFGIVMWELLTGEEPYEDLHYGAIIGGIVSNTLRPTVPESCNPEWRSLMEKCWSSEPSLRPNFTEIINKLRSMAASLPRKG